MSNFRKIDEKWKYWVHLILQSPTCKSFFSSETDHDEGDVDNDIEDNIAEVKETSDLAISVFKSNQSSIKLDNYNIVTRRFLECESTVKGNGLRRIVACAFKMNLNSDFCNITLNEAKYHLRATLFAYNLSSSTKSVFPTMSRNGIHILYPTP